MICVLFAVFLYTTVGCLASSNVLQKNGLNKMFIRNRLFSPLGGKMSTFNYCFCYNTILCLFPCEKQAFHKTPCVFFVSSLEPYRTVFLFNVLCCLGNKIIKKGTYKVTMLLKNSNLFHHLI